VVDHFEKRYLWHFVMIPIALPMNPQGLWGDPGSVIG